MALKQKQFVEMDFTGRVKDTDEVFDTTNPKDAKGITDEKVKPLKICIGEQMLLEKFDKALEGKEVGKEYIIELGPNDAFGDRKKDLVKMIPLKIFTDKGVMPYRGLMLNMDGMVVRIVSVSGGRVITDFNNPLAGKSLVYKFKVNRVIEDKKEQIESLLDNLLKIDSSMVKIDVKDKKSELTFSLKDNEFKILQQISKPFSEKVKSLVGVDVELKNENKSEVKK